MNQRINTDITIVGGGIAGLWLLNRLRTLGYHVILLERDRLGCDQTGLSQGMIHGGMKYALGGLLTGASEAIAGMPAAWRACLRGEGAVDLRDVAVLSEAYYLWSGSSAPARLAAFLGSRLVRGRAVRVSGAALPDVFQADAFRGNVYRLDDLVLDVHSLVNSLYQKQRDCIFRMAPERREHVSLNGDGSLGALIAENGVTIKAKRYIFAAGAGNERLLQLCGLSLPAMQRRPLHQVLVKHSYPNPLYAHSIDLVGGSKPRLTITTHLAEKGHYVWYIGGALAENGIARSEGEQIDMARRELKETLPWIELAHPEWRTLRCDRAEPAQKEAARPDAHFVKQVQNIIVVWPVKLTLAPALGEEVETLIAAQHILPSRPDASEAGVAGKLPRAAPAMPFWISEFE